MGPVRCADGTHWFCQMESHGKLPLAKHKGLVRGNWSLIAATRQRGGGAGGHAGIADAAMRLPTWAQNWAAPTGSEGAGGTAGVATMLAEADLVVFCYCCQLATCSAQSGDSLPRPPFHRRSAFRNPGFNVGYARVSSTDQDFDSQVDRLKAGMDVFSLR